MTTSDHKINHWQAAMHPRQLGSAWLLELEGGVETHIVEQRSKPSALAVY